jgi:hypothetical protein
MATVFFLVGLSLAFLVALAWGFAVLPRESWQILAAIPRRMQGENHWAGVNITYYGFFVACSSAVSLALFTILMGAFGVPLKAIGTLGLSLLLLCVPAAKLVAILVEKKRHTFTVAGAHFTGLLIAPGLICCMNCWMEGVFGCQIDPFMGLAALSIVYAFGEALGRLACISFGCCYGKPLEDCPPLVRMVFRKCAFVFRGKTRKVAYAHGLDGVRLVPVQAVTAIVNVLVGITGSYLFLEGRIRVSFLVTIAGTQLWRAFSETLRADYRGGKKGLSIYQHMALTSTCLGTALALFLPGVPAVLPDVHILQGLALLWNPAAIICIQAVWLAVFLFLGRSTVTASRISIHTTPDAR